MSINEISELKAEMLRVLKILDNIGENPVIVTIFIDEYIIDESIQQKMAETPPTPTYKYDANTTDEADRRKKELDAFLLAKKRVDDFNLDLIKKHRGISVKEMSMVFFKPLRALLPHK